MIINLRLHYQKFLRIDTTIYPEIRDETGLKYKRVFFPLEIHQKYFSDSLWPWIWPSLPPQVVCFIAFGIPDYKTHKKQGQVGYGELELYTYPLLKNAQNKIKNNYDAAQKFYRMHYRAAHNLGYWSVRKVIFEKPGLFTFFVWGRWNRVIQPINQLPVIVEVYREVDVIS